MRLYIGLMSGTSMDGIDAALVDVDTHQLIEGVTIPYRQSLFDLLQDVVHADKVSLPTLLTLHHELGKAFAEAALLVLNKAHKKSDEVLGIGSHGQTILHDAFADIPYTLQLACPHVIAEKTGLTVVADFRTRDLILGGQGAPFAPIYHQALFEPIEKPMAIVNVGGIANVSFLHPSNPVCGYDTGPGNCLMDDWISQNLHKSYDHQGAWAKSGEIIPSLLERLIRDDYFHIAAPKSIGKEYFSREWLKPHLNPTYKAQDVQATLLALTVRSIAHSIQNHQDCVDTIFVCGGGAHNQALIDQLRQNLPAKIVKPFDRRGLNPDYLEAMMFAWLAHKRLNHETIDLRSITNAKKPSLLGVIYEV